MTYLQGKTKKEVLAQYQKLRRDLDDGLDTSANYTFAQWADIWFDSQKDNISPTTRQSYTYTLRKLKDTFGHRKLESIKPFDIERYLRSLREEGLSDSYLAKTRAMLYQIYHKAVANDLVRKNPARFAEKMRSTGLRERKDAFTAEEIELLMEHLPRIVSAMESVFCWAPACGRRNCLGRRDAIFLRMAPASTLSRPFSK